MSFQPNAWRSFSPSPSKLDDDNWPPLPFTTGSFKSQPACIDIDPLSPVHTDGPVWNAKREAETFLTSPPRVKKNRRVKEPECIVILSSSEEDDQEHVLTSRNVSEKAHLTPMKNTEHEQDVFLKKRQPLLTTSDFITDPDDDLPEPEDLFSVITRKAESSEDEAPLIRKRHHQPYSNNTLGRDSIRTKDQVGDDLPEPEDLFSIIAQKTDSSEDEVTLIGKYHRRPYNNNTLVRDSIQTQDQISKKMESSDDEIPPNWTPYVTGLIVQDVYNILERVSEQGERQTNFRHIVNNGEALDVSIVKSLDEWPVHPEPGTVVVCHTDDVDFRSQVAGDGLGQLRNYGTYKVVRPYQGAKGLAKTYWKAKNAPEYGKVAFWLTQGMNKLYNQN